MIPYGRQQITDDDIEAVVRVLNSNYLTQGPYTQFFEQKIMSYCNARYAIAVNSATSALHISCLALGVGVGDSVWTSPITFVASANCARYCGADVDFVDIDPHSYNMCIDKLTEKLECAEKLNKLPKVVIPVHMCGQSCDMAKIFALSQKYGFKIIEDASHAIGAKYLNNPVGSCQYSDITVLSFHPVKIITSGEGGMALTNNVEISKRLKLLRSHGVTRESLEMTSQPMEETWQYQQISIGYNYRMTDIHAALGVSQMDRLDAYVAIRKRIADTYDCKLKELPIIMPQRADYTNSAWHLYVIRIDNDRTDRRQKEVLHALHNMGVAATIHYIPVYRQPYYESLGYKKGYCPQAERYFSEAMSIPIFPGLSEKDQLEVVGSLEKALR